MLLEDYLVDDKCSIIEAIRQINNNSKGIVYVTSDKKLCGSVTDGDVRRYLLEKGNLEQNIMMIANINPYYLLENREKEARRIMEQNSISSLPIVDVNGSIIKIIFSDWIIGLEKKPLHIPVIIMAGGKGTRLYPYTQILPKPLIPIGDQTITEHIMDRFFSYGCEDFTMIVNYKKHFIKSYFLDHECKYKVGFVEEEKFLGTGGGLKLLQKKYNSTFFMTNCDILVEEDYGEILEYHRQEKNLVTMVCAEKNLTIPYGTVELDKEGKATALKEKPKLSFLTNTGLYVIEPEFIDLIPDNTFIHITDLIQTCIKEKRKVGVYRIEEEKWMDMGQLEELERMKKKLNVE